nr:RNA-directed DNA polymerase, eukaryota, reverse transcriptase zinc-binding domain protein [Tanacetum cinerariifolium]
MGVDDWNVVTRKNHGYRTKEDDLAKISISVFVTNFPESASAKDLFHLCKAYGHIVDSYIPIKGSKSGKRFGFVRFINVFSVERLISNLCTLWIGKHRLLANVTKFQRPPTYAKASATIRGHAHSTNSGVKDPLGHAGRPFNLSNPSVANQPRAPTGSYANIVNEVKAPLSSTPPALILEDSCLIDRDFSRHVLGKVKDFSSIPTLYTIISDEGFSTKLFTRSLHQREHLDFRIIVKGKVYMVRAKELFTWNPVFLTLIEKDCNSDIESVIEPLNNIDNKEEFDDEHAIDINEVPETVCGANSSSNKFSNGPEVAQQSEVPFGLNDIFNNKKTGKTSKLSPSLSHPPGFTSNFLEEQNNNEAKENLEPLNAKVMSSSQEIHVVEHNDHLSQKGTNNGGSVLDVMKDVIRIGEAMGYSMEGDSLGNSGGILCIWEATIFKKENVTISDNFIVIYDSWLPNNAKILFIAVYAPQQASSKSILWDYISVLLNCLNCKTIVMGDFNEVRSSEKRRGSCFNPYSARRFDHFIHNSGLVDIKLEGYTFTWSHPLATKMSKLNRFLVSDGIYNLFPSITAICLDRHISDHRPILLGSTWFDLAGVIDKDLDSGLVSETIILHRLDLKRKLLNINDMESKDYIQKSKVTWAIEGDENSKFFHGIINKKRSQLAIHGIFVDGSWCTEPGMIKDAFVNHFEARFKDLDNHRFKINFEFPKRLSQQQADDLERAVSRDDIKTTVWNCRDNKSPGPDGYSFGFIKKYWDLIGTDVCEAVEHFFVKCSFPNGCNSSFIALIPKISDAKIGERFPSYKLDWGDPLAPYLFILIMESLHLSIRRLVDNGLFKGIQLSGSVIISHLLYADHAMFIGEWSDENLKVVLNTLKCFFLASGLHINICKSQFLRVEVSYHVVQQASSSIGCSIMQNQFCYLGVTVGDCMTKIKAWENIIVKLRSRLSKWKVKTLFLGSRLTLLKYVLGASPVYSMSIFKVPRGMLKTMEAIRSRFFNGIGQEDAKITWIAWNNVLASKKRGGLGVSSFFALNRALLLKWVWRFIYQDGSLWSRVIRVLYGPKIDVHPTHTLSNWCAIISDLALHIKYPRLFALEQNRDISVAEKLNSQVSQSFRREPRGGIEHQQLSDLVSLLDSATLNNSKDQWYYDLSGDGEFRVKDLRNFIDDIYIPSHTEATRWVRLIPIKVNIFVWRARRDCLPTRSNLLYRGVNIVSPNCPICHDHEEVINHTLFCSNLAQSMLKRVCRWWNLDPQGWSSFQEWQTWFLSIRLPAKNKDMLEGVFYVAWWSIWRFRNHCVFEDRPPRRSTIFDDIVLPAFTWCHSRCNSTFLWVDWLKSPHFISL